MEWEKDFNENGILCTNGEKRCCFFGKMWGVLDKNRKLCEYFVKNWQKCLHFYFLIGYNQLANRYFTF